MGIIVNNDLKMFHVYNDLNVNESIIGRALNDLRDWCESRWGKVPRKNKRRSTSIRWFIVGNHLYVSVDAELTEFQLAWL